MAGKTVAVQIRQASRHLGYGPDDWRPRELWYGRCASIAAVLDLRERYRAWSERETAPADSSALARRVAAVRRLLAELEREVAGLEAEVAAANDRGLTIVDTSLHASRETAILV